MNNQTNNQTSTLNDAELEYVSGGGAKEDFEVLMSLIAAINASKSAVDKVQQRGLMNSVSVHWGR